MKPIIILCMFVAGALANAGSVSVSYGQNSPPQVSYGAPPPAAPVVRSYTPPQARSYAAPAAPVVRSYSAPAPAAPVVRAYSAPAPAAPVVRAYSAPAPAAPVVRAYSAPAPAAPVLSYAAPAPAAPVLSYAAPAPAAPVLSYAAPAPAAPLAYGSSYGSSEVRAPVIPITRFSHEIEEGKGHRLSFETGHGISHEEHTHVQMNPNAVGTFEDALSGKALVTKTGTISHTSPEGHRINLQYTADQDGFRATGDHLPVPPTLTPEVAEATRQHFIAFEAAARASAAAPEQPLSSYGASYGGYAAPAPVVRAPPPPAAAPPAYRSPY